jgi:lysophospholipase L1-like esterase
MNRRTRRRVIAGLLSVLFSVLLIEGALAIFDPLGIRGLEDWQIIYEHIIEHPTRQYVLTPGRYTLRSWTVTQRADYTRRIPDNYNGGCRVVFLGDSVTWSTGVNDAETWVNLIARGMPQVTAINPAFDGYNSEHLRWVWHDYPQADIGIYLVYPNDIEATASLVGQTAWLEHINSLSMLMRYRDFIMTHANWTPRQDAERFARDMDDLTKDDRIVLVAFNDAFGRKFAARWFVHLIPPYVSRISATDVHADAAGNREIAAAIAPIVERAVRERCTAIL